MGLDMYLYTERYVSGWRHGSNEEAAIYEQVLEAAGMTEFATAEAPWSYVKVTCAYWRKANAIHRWFVENVQGGEDECEPHHVSREQLMELRDQCANALDAREMVGAAVAEERLPTQAGFFFGSTDYDEWYWQDLENTVEQLDRVLNISADVTFEYQSSW